MSKSLYRRALSEPFHLVLKFPTLWILGVVSILFGQFGLSNFLGQLFIFSDPSQIPARLWWWSSSWLLFINAEAAFWLVWLIIILAGFAIAIALFGAAGQGALMAAAAEWFRHGQRPQFEIAWHRGVRHFWRLLAVQIVQKLFLFGLVLWVALVSLAPAGAATALQFFGLVIFYGGLLFLVLAASVIASFASAYIIEEELKVLPAVAAAARLFTRHPAVAVEMSLLLLLVNAVLFLIIAASSFVVLIPALVIWLIAALAQSSALWFAGLLGAVGLFMVVIVFLGGLFNCYAAAVWMYLWQELHREGAASRVVYWLERLFRRRL